MPAETAEHQNVPIEPLAIIGVACRYGGEASSIDGLLKALMAARSAHGPVPKDRLDEGFYYHPDPNHMGTTSTHGGYFLSQSPHLFDSSFFQLPAQEVFAMDPQQKMLLENVYHALENAGIPLDEVRATSTSVFVGCSSNDHLALANSDPLMFLKCKSTGTTPSILANRVSWFYDLRGTSYTIDSACSSSMVAFHEACNNLRLGQSSMAIISGVNYIEDPQSTVNLSNIGVLSPDGQCFSYDERANGYGRGEGVGTVIVKPLWKALEDGNHVRAVIRATGSSQDGKTAGITLPNHLAQQQLIKRLYQAAGIDPSLTSYVESHGTGTPVGDPLEIKAITAALLGDRTTPLYVGSIKTVIGHQEGGAGIAGLIAATLAVESGKIPPLANFQHLNQSIPRKENLVFARCATPWPRDDIRRASVNSFGYGGTNAHAIIENIGGFLHTHPTSEHRMLAHTLQDLALMNGSPKGPIDKPDRHAMPEKNGDHLVEGPVIGNAVYLISSFEEEGIQRNVSRLLAHLQSVSFVGAPDQEQRFLASLRYTLNRKRTKFDWRSWLVAYDLKTLRRALEERVQVVKKSPVPKVICFIFTGQGAGWVGMGSDLLLYPVFRQRMKEASAYLKNLGSGWDLFDLIATRTLATDPHEPRYAQSATVAVQVALVDQLRSWGLAPSTVVGHSSGEIAAAFCAGKISRQAAWKIAFSRGQVCAKQIDRGGAMMAAALSEHEANALLAKLQQEEPLNVKVGCINGPKSVTFTGKRSGLVRLKDSLDTSGILNKLLPVDVAYHSPDLDSAAPEYLSLMHDLGISDKTDEESQDVVMVSSVTGLPVHKGKVENPSYWVENLLSPVRFHDALRCALRLQSTKHRTASAKEQTHSGTVIEIGPHSTLKSVVRDILSEHPELGHVEYCAILKRGETNRATLLDTLGMLSCRGYPIRLDDINHHLLSAPASQNRVLESLPPYAFDDSKAHHTTSRLVEGIKFPPYQRHELLGVPVPDTNDREQRWRNFIRLTEVPWLATNKLHGKVIFPTVAYLLMAAEGALQRVKEPNLVTGLRYRQVAIRSSLVIPDTDEGVETLFSIQPANIHEGSRPDWLAFRIVSFDAEGKSWIEHCVGLVRVEMKQQGGGAESGWPDIEPGLNQLRSKRESIKFVVPLDPESMYSDFASAGMLFGKDLRNVQKIDLSQDRKSCLSTVAISDVPGTAHGRYLMHPCTFESILLLQVVLCGTGRPKVATYVEDVWISNGIDNSPPSVLDSFITTERKSATSWHFRVLVEKHESKVPQVVIHGMELVALPSAPQSRRYQDQFHVVEWNPVAKLLKSLEPIASYPPVAAPVRTLTVDDHRGLQLASSIIILDTIDSLESLPPLQPHHEKYVRWMKQQLQSIDADSLPLLQKVELDAIRASAELKASLFNQVANTTARGELLKRVGSQIIPILEQKVDCLELMFGRGEFIARFYDESIPSDVVSGVSRYLKCLPRNMADVKVLEVGAGTGGATSFVLQSLTAPLGAEDRQAADQSQHAGLEYHFTDISSGSFEKAQVRLGQWSDLLHFKTLDIERDPVEQGFELGSYDLIVACNVIHATRDLNISLGNIRHLLKSGGELVLIENVNADFLSATLVFGLLPGWWRATEAFRQDVPLIDECRWQTVMAEAGFEPRLLIHEDCSDEGREMSTFVARAQSPSEGDGGRSGQKYLVVYSSSHGQASYELAESVAESIGQGQGTGSKASVLELGNVSPASLADSVCISILDLYAMDLSELDKDEFSKIHLLLNRSQNLLWVTGDPENAPKAGMATGLIRTIRWERDLEAVNFVLLHIRDPCPSLETLSPEIVHICRQAFESSGVIPPNSELAWQDGVVLTSRLVPKQDVNDCLNSDSEFVTAWRPLGEIERPVKLITYESGSTTKIGFIEDQEAAFDELRPDQVRVQVEAVHLNHRELLQIGEATPGQGLGRDGAGVVTDVGLAVKDLAIGDSVMFIRRPEDGGSFTTSLVADRGALLKVSRETMSLREAATLPLACCTAYGCLVEMARLGPDESVVIQSAATEVGQAAIQLAQHIGARIIARVSSQEDQDLLVQRYTLPRSHVLCVEEVETPVSVLALTGGKGADVVVVLESRPPRGGLSYDPTSYVSSFGRVVHLQQTELRASAAVNRLTTTTTPITTMTMKTRNVTTSFFNLDEFWRHKARRMLDIFAAVATLIAQRQIRPHQQPVLPMTFSQVGSAIEEARKGDGLDSVVFTPQQNDLLSICMKPIGSLRFPENATYLLLGGFGGVGRLLARWMFSRGARNFILLSRSGLAKEPARVLYDELTTAGCKVEARGCDISDEEAVRQILNDCYQWMPPIRGCVQASLVVRDTLFSNMTHEQYMAVIRPKVQGTLNVAHALPAAAAADLDFFVMLSSGTSIIGNRGQANYAAANTFLDTFAKSLVKRGIPATSISLGGLESVGWLAENPLAMATSYAFVTPERLLAILEFHMDPCWAAGASTATCHTITSLRSAADFGRSLPSFMLFPLFSWMMKSSRAGGSAANKGDGAPTVSPDESVSTALEAAVSRHDALSIVSRAIVSKVSKAMLIKPQDLELTRPLLSYGVDSLVAVDLRAWFQRELAVTIKVDDLLGNVSVSELAERATESSKLVPDGLPDDTPQMSV